MIKLWLRWNICIEYNFIRPQKNGEKRKYSKIKSRVSVGEQCEPHYIGYISSFVGSISARLSGPYTV